MLFLVPTPIGNLQDITLRALSVLGEVDLILCEDTRRSFPLLQHFKIEKPLRSLHQFNEESSLKEILERLQKGGKIALISDAGTPAIADPGERLVAECVRRGVEVIPLPGASSVLTSLSASGLATLPFQWVGFLPRKKGDKERQILDILRYKGTTVSFETPHRLIETLELIELLAPTRTLVLARELTKKFETFYRGPASEILKNFKDHPLGEMVLIFGPPEEEPEKPVELEKLFEKLICEQGLRAKEASERVHFMTGLSKREAYKMALNFLDGLPSD